MTIDYEEMAKSLFWFIALYLIYKFIGLEIMLVVGLSQIIGRLK